MSIRSAMSWTSRTSSLLLASLVAAGVLTGCRTSPSAPAPAPPIRAASSVLALPSANQIAAAELAGMPATGVPGRRNHVLGGPPTDAFGPSVARLDAWSDQRVVNGRVYGNLRWRSRSVEVRGR
jgi:hypothetical protein